jgi:hypothetical protein
VARPDPHAAHVVFHALVDAEMALEEAAASGAKAVLRTAPGAIAYAGPLYLLKIVEAAASGAHGAALAGAVIDCGREAVLAFAALRSGWRALLFTGRGRSLSEVRAAAAAAGATLHSTLPPALDPTHDPDPRAACRTLFVHAVRS